MSRCRYGRVPCGLPFRAAPLPGLYPAAFRTESSVVPFINNAAMYPGVPPGAKGRSGGFLGAACGARCRVMRAERQRAVGGRERSEEEAAREHRVPGGIM